MRRVDSLEKTLMMGGIGGRRRRGRPRMRWLDGITQTRWTWVWVNSGSWWWTGRPEVLQFMGSQRVGHDWVTELNWRAYSWRCLSRGDFSIELGQELTESKLSLIDVWRVNIIIPSSTSVESLVPTEFKHIFLYPLRCNKGFKLSALLLHFCLTAFLSSCILLFP